MIKKILSSALVVLMLLGAGTAYAQCPMCKHNVESSLRKDSTRKTGLGLNNGIVLLLAMPYAAFVAVGSIWYFNARKKRRAIAG